jgi:hypothetical protein
VTPYIGQVHSQQLLEKISSEAKAILKKGTRGSFHHWVQDDFDLAVTMLQKPHALGGFDLTPNVLAQISAKVAMASRFLQLVGSLPPEEQKLWLPNQLAHDPDSWHAPHLLNFKTGYDILVNNHNCKVQEMSVCCVIYCHSKFFMVQATRLYNLICGTCIKSSAVRGPGPVVRRCSP